MLSIDFIRQNLEVVKNAANQKNRKVDFDSLLKLDDRRRELLASVNKLREERNKLARLGGKEEAMKRGKEVKEELKKLEETAKKTEAELNGLLLTVPNVPYAEVPAGKDETQNVEVRKVGDLPKFDFEPLSHLELINKHDLADMERGTKISGFRGYFLKNEMAVLHFAVLFYVFGKLVKKGYTPIIAPAIVKEFTLFGNGQFPWGREEVYMVEKDDVFLAGTAEVPVTAYFADEILNEKDLPKKFVAFSPCFRREAGSYGKDTKGLYRLHEFWKVEQVVVAEADDKKAREYHEELQANTEEVLRDLELPYRVLLMCTGDMGEPQAKKYDTEVWMPSRNGYGEIASNSIMTDFQARRLKMRYRTKAGEVKHVYTLNDTAVPSPRILIAILENFQMKNGSIKVPKVLQPFTGFGMIGNHA